LIGPFVSSHTILIADEDRDTRVILRAVLERQHFLITDAASGDEAIAAYKLHAPDLVILNYPMACGDGASLVQHLRGLTGAQTVPILNLTSRVVPQLIQQAGIEGVDVSVSKPLDVDGLLRIINRLMTSPRLASLQ